MTDPRYERLQGIFLRARRLSRAGRGAFLDDACRDDPDLRPEVERLLAHDEAPHSFVDRAAAGGGAGYLAREIATTAAPGAPDDRAPPLPERIGRYAIVRVIDRGGMGVVYEAEQEEPHRRVALKVIRPGLVAAGALKRFRLEAAVLGRLQHPGIAPIFEAGTADGQPFFAMELVDGLPLLEHAAAKGLATRERLELVARICDALQHAHQQGVIHRDLKPSNILVVDDRGGIGQPRILDFGVARATDSDIQAVTVRTEVGELVGTVPYMSPEQAAGDPGAIDTRTDIYSLGVLAFELLTGRRPYDLSGKMLHEAVRVIREDEPSRLSAFDRGCRGDVETIVAKALEKEKDRRYGSAAEMAADIRRYLCDQPIVARPASSFYQLHKFTRRHRALVTGVAIAFVAMLVGTVAALREAHRAHLAETDATAKGQLATDRAAALEVTVWGTYRTAIASAGSALDDDDPIDSARFLALAPAERRGWEHGHLAARLDATAETFACDTPVRAARFDAGGDRVTTATEAGLVRTWDPVHRTVVGEIRLDADLPPLRHVKGQARHAPACFSDDGTALLGAVGAGDDPRTIALWDLTDGRRRAELTPEQIVEASGGATKLISLALAPDASRAAIGGRNGSLLWDPLTGDLSRFLRSKQSALEFSADGALLAGGYGSANGARAYVCDALTGSRLDGPFRNGINRVDAVALSADGGRLLFGSEDAMARVIDLESGDTLHVLRGHTRGVTSVAIDPTGQWMATGSADHTVRVWEAETGALHAVLAEQPDVITAVGFGGDGAHLLTTSDRSIRVYDLPIRREVMMLHGHEPAAVYGVRCCGDGKLVSVDFAGRLRLWDAASGAALGALRTGKRALAVAASPAGTLVATAHEGGAVRVWDADTGALVRTLHCSSGARVTALDCDAAGRRLVARTRRGVDVWDFGTGAEVAFIEAQGRKQIGAVAISPDGRLVAADVGNGLGVWAAEAGEAVFQPITGAGLAGPLAFSPGATLLAVGAARNRVLLRDARTGEVLRTLSGHTDKLFALAFSPDGTRLASGANDRTIILWDVATGSSVLTLKAHRSFVSALTFSPDGETLYSGSGEGAIGVWSTAPSAEWHYAAALLEQQHEQALPLVERLLRSRTIPPPWPIESGAIPISTPRRAGRRSR